MKLRQVMFRIVLLLGTSAAAFGAFSLLVIYLLGAPEPEAVSIEEFQQENGVPVRVVRVEPKDFTRHLLVDGDVMAHDRAMLRSKIDEVVEEVRVRPGETVSAGETLVVFRETDILADIEAKRRAHKEAQWRYERYSKLLESKVITEDRMEQVETALENAAAQKQAAESRLAFTKVASPVDGIVESRWVEPGEYKGKKDQLLSVIDLTNVDVRALVPEQHVARLRVGMKGEFQITSDGSEQRWFEGTVSRIVPSTDDPDRFFDVYLNVKNERVAGEADEGGDWLILPGMYAEVRCALATKAGVLAVPEDAVRYEGGLRVIFLLEEGTAERPVAVADGEVSAETVGWLGRQRARVGRGWRRLVEKTGGDVEESKPEMEEVPVTKAKRCEVVLGQRDDGRIELKRVQVRRTGEKGQSELVPLTLSSGARVIGNPSDDIREGTVVRVVEERE